MFRQFAWFALGLMLALGMFIGVSYVGWLFFAKKPVRMPVEPPPNEKLEPEEPFKPVAPFEKSTTGEPGIAASKAEEAKVLPRADVPTLAPAKRLGDRKYRGPRVLYPLVLSADGKIAAFSTGYEVMNSLGHWRGQEFVVWDVAGAQEIGRVGGPHFSHAAFSPDGNTLYAGGASERFRPSQLRVWDTKSGKLLQEREVSLFALSADGKTLATVDIHVGTFDRMSPDEPIEPWRCTVAIWNAADFKQRAAYTYTSFIPTAIALSPDGSKVTVAAHDRLATFDAATGKPLWKTKLDAADNTTGEFFELLFSPDGKSIASAEQWHFPTRHYVRVWNVATGKGRKLNTDERADGRHPPNVGMAFTSDSKSLFIPFEDAVVSVAVADGEIPPQNHGVALEKRKEFIKNGIRPSNMEALYSFAVSGDGKTAVLGGRFKGDTCGLRVVDVATREVKYPPKLEAITPPFPPADEFLGPNEPFHKTSPEWLQLPDGRELTWRSYVDKLRIGKRGENPQQIGTTEILNYAVTPDGETIITRGKGQTLPNGKYEDDPQLRFRDSNGKAWGEVVGPTWPQVWARRAIALSADGRTVATLNPDEGIWLWEIATAKPRLRLDRAGKEDIYRFAFSRDGRYIMSNDYHAQSGLVWDLRGVVDDKKDAPDAKELAALWDALRGDDASAAYKSIWRLASHPKESVPFLKEKAKDVPAVTAARFATRPFDKDIVLARRFVETLEQCGTADAIALLKELAEMPAFAEPAGAAHKRAAAK